MTTLDTGTGLHGYVSDNTEHDTVADPTSGGTALRFTGMDTVSTPPLRMSDEVRSLLRDLRHHVEGEVRFDSASLSAYSTDSSNYRLMPIGVVVPKTLDDVVAAVAVCRRHGVPITHRGGGTSLAGQTCNVAVIIDSSKYLDRVESIDPDTRTAWVEPGCNLDHLRQLAGEHGLTYGPDPSTHSRNTIGGMIGNNSCGTHSVMSEMYGPGPLTVHQVLELDVVTYRGDRFTVGPMSPEELDAAIAADDPKGRLLAQLRDLRDKHLAAIRTGFPRIPAARVRLQPRLAAR